MQYSAYAIFLESILLVEQVEVQLGISLELIPRMEYRTDLTYIYLFVARLAHKWNVLWFVL